VSDVKATTNEGWPALIFAARSGTDKIVELLIPVSDVEATYNDGWTALISAVMFGNEKIVELLIPVSDVKATNNNGKTALDIAKSSENDQIVELLQQHKVNLTLSNPFLDPESPTGNSGQHGQVSPTIGLGLAALLSIFCVFLRINEL
jgi:ankyrin repeat protein